MESNQSKSSGFITNLKYVFIPGSQVKDLDKHLLQHEGLYKPRKRNHNWLKSPLTIIGLVLIFFIVTIAVFDSWIATYSYQEALWIDYTNAWSPPSAENILGTSYGGRDVFSRMIYGTRISLIISFSSVGISLIVGSLLGLFSAYYGGWIDIILMRITDVILAFPGLIFAIALILVWGRYFTDIILIFSIIGIPYYARLIRVAVLRTKEMQYIAAAKSMGARNRRIIFLHVLPNSFQSVLIYATFDIGRTIINLAILAFLGFSVRGGWIQWGSDISIGAFGRYLIEAPWAAFWPCVMVVITALGFMLLGDGLRDALDPRYHFKSF